MKPFLNIARRLLCVEWLDVHCRPEDYDHVLSVALIVAGCGVTVQMNLARNNGCGWAVSFRAGWPLGRTHWLSFDDHDVHQWMERRLQGPLLLWQRATRGGDPYSDAFMPVSAPADPRDPAMYGANPPFIRVEKQYPQVLDLQAETHEMARRHREDWDGRPRGIRAARGSLGALLPRVDAAEDLAALQCHFGGTPPADINEMRRNAPYRAPVDEGDTEGSAAHKMNGGVGAKPS